MDNRRKTFEKVLGILVLSIILYSLFALYADFNKLLQVFYSFKPETILSIMLLTLSSLLIRFLRWEYLLKKLDIELNRIASLEFYLLGFSMILSPGKIGEGIKSYLMERDRNIAISKSFSVVIAERGSDLLGLSLIGIIAYGLIFLRIEQTGVLLLLFLLTTHLALDNASNVLDFLENKNPPLKLGHIEKFGKIYRDSKILFHPRTQAISLVYSTISWALNGFSLYLLVNSVSSVNLEKSMLAFSSSSLAGALSMIPGGLGVVEGGMTATLQVFQVQKDLAVASTLTLRLFSFWLSFVIGSSVLGYYLYRRKRSNRI